MTEPWRLTLSEGMDRMNQGSLTASEWIRSLLARIDHPLGVGVELRVGVGVCGDLAEPGGAGDACAGGCDCCAVGQNGLESRRCRPV